MSNPTVSFRISDYHLARGLRAIRAIEPNWQLTTPANLIKTIFIDYIAKSEHFNNTPPTVSEELLQEITYARSNLNKQERFHEKIEYLPRLGVKTFEQARKQLQEASRQREREIEDARLFEQIKREAREEQATKEKELDNQIDLAFQTGQRLPKPSEFHDPNNTDSEISTLTDFSPPKDWIDSEN
jgi:hypothetical protein